MTSLHQVYGHAAVMDHAIVHLAQCSLSALKDCSFEAVLGVLLLVLVSSSRTGARRWRSSMTCMMRAVACKQASLVLISAHLLGASRVEGFLQEFVVHGVNTQRFALL